ncbi:MAG: zf-HC2 domain-containing protein [Candidatus Omnitrophica bacterium]|nr:zf-HC2 domain-containing protein [Candidatus Omnitrophota bacterium]
MLNWEKTEKTPLITSCKQAARLVSVSIERPLSLRENITMRIHLWMCRTCTLYRRQISLLRKAFVRHEEVLALTPPSEGESLDAQSKKRIQDAIVKSSCGETQ